MSEPGEVSRLTNVTRPPLAESFSMFLHKFAPGAAAMLIVLTGCQTPGTFTSGEQALKSFPSECTMRASIPPDSTVTEIEDFKEAMARAGVSGPHATIQAVSQGTNQTQMCVCSKSWDMSKASKVDAQDYVTGLMRSGEWTQTRGDFDHLGPVIA
jgi:hypothetical protein